MAFITDNRLDERAVEALLACPDHIQRTVVARGELHGMNNPSSAVLGRIRQVKMRAEAEALRAGGAYGYGFDQVELFIMNNSLDERAAELLRSCGPDVQYAVMSRGDLSDARNPSSAALGRIKEAQAKGVGRGFGVLQRVVDDALATAVRTFVQTNYLDERASDALMNSSPEVVNAVISRGSVVDAKNPSSAVLGRIKDAKATVSPEQATSPGGASWAQVLNAQMFQGQTLEQEVEFFIEHGGVDERAAQAFRCAEAGVQRYVMDKGGVRDARNPSSALLARIRDGKSKLEAGEIVKLDPQGGFYGAIVPVAAQTVAAQTVWPTMQAGCFGVQAVQMTHEQELDAFLNSCAIDDRATEALLCQTIEVQRVVMSRGSLADARNPSSAVLGRIKDANSELSVFGTVGAGAGGAGMVATPMTDAGSLAPAANGGTFRPEVDAAAAAEWAQAHSAWAAQVMAPMSQMVPNPLEDFCREYTLDERAVEALKCSPPEVQAMVLAGGGLQTARNPSSAVLGRIKEAQQKLGLGGDLNRQKNLIQDAAAAAGPMSFHNFSTATTIEEKVEEFIVFNKIDERAAQSFRCCTGEVAEAVIKRGNLVDARNPSSALLGRIKDAQSACGYSSGGGSALAIPDVIPRASPDVEAFIAGNGLDERAAELLRATPVEVQFAVLSRGSLRDARNPSSAVLGRIKDAAAQGNKPQSWNGYNVDSSNHGGFSGAGASFGDSSNLAGFGGASFGGAAYGLSPVEQFILDNGIDDRAAGSLRGASPDVQQAVLGRGGLKDAKNASSAVIGRIKDAKSGSYGRGGWSNGGASRFQPY